MRILIKFFVLTIVFVVAVGVMNTLAQPLPPAGVPIDGGLGIVIAACAAYGGKKLYNKSFS